MDKRQKILIVDDAEFNRVILKEILGETYNYLEAENGNQEIQIVEENPEIDLMLLDILRVYRFLKSGSADFFHHINVFSEVFDGF